MEPQAYRDMVALQETHWWFCARRGILAKLLERFVPQGGRVLEVGAGTGANLPMLEGWGAVTALEPNPFAAAYLAKHFAATVVEDAIPTGRQCGLLDFDLIAAFDVLEHIEADQRALEFMARRLCPGGWLALTVPAFPFFWSSHDEVLHHQRRYRKRALCRMLRDAGLNVVFARYFNFLLFPPAAVVRLLDRFRKGLARSTAKQLPPAVNRCLGFVFGLEAHLLRWISPPFGLSIVVLGRKPG